MRLLVRKAMAWSGKIIPGRTALLGLLCLALFLIGQIATDLFVYDRAAVNAGEWWRMLTGQLVHVGLDHLFWDLTAFILLAALIEPKGILKFWTIMAISFIPVAAFVHYGLPELSQYSGLSGGLNTLFFITTYEIWRRDGGWLAPAMLMGNTLKIVTEISMGDALFTSTAWPPVPEVHGIGFFAGFLFVLWHEIKETKRIHFEYA